MAVRRASSVVVFLLLLALLIASDLVVEQVNGEECGTCRLEGPTWSSGCKSKCMDWCKARFKEFKTCCSGGACNCFYSCPKPILTESIMTL